MYTWFTSCLRLEQRFPICGPRVSLKGSARTSTKSTSVKVKTNINKNNKLFSE
jgi:hypothetical protein